MNKRCKLCQNYIKNEKGKFECSRFLMGILSCHFTPDISEEKSFEEQIKVLSQIAFNKKNEFQNAVDNITKLIQIKYPELRAEFSISDGGVIFVNDDTMEEFYGIENVYEMLGKR